MNEQEMLGAIRTIIKEEVRSAVKEEVHLAIQEELRPINTRLDSIDKRLTSLEESVEIIKEDTAITRATVNTLVEWVEVAADIIKLPFPIKNAK